MYAATKGATEQISRVLAKNFGARGIAVNCVSPGPTDTDLFRSGKTAQRVTFMENAHPVKRLGQPDEVASAVTFLASPEASWVNGQNIRVNGVSTFAIQCVQYPCLRKYLGLRSITRMVWGWTLSMQMNEIRVRRSAL